MGCHSEEFTLALLERRSYFKRMSSYLIKQLLKLECDDLSRFLRAVDAVEGEGVASAPRTKQAGEYKGILQGYSHFHFLRDDWGATNLALKAGEPVENPINETIDHVVEQIFKKFEDPFKGSDGFLEKFKNRINGKATGDWVIYKPRASGNFYLAIHKHVGRNSPEEHVLRNTLDLISQSIPLEQL